MSQVPAQLLPRRHFANDGKRSDHVLAVRAWDSRQLRRKRGLNPFAMNRSGSIEPLVHAWSGVLESLRPQEKVTRFFVVIEQAFDRPADVANRCAAYGGHVLA